MNFFATDFTALSNLLEVLYALMWALFYVVLGSIPIHAVCCVVKKEKSLYTSETSKIDYFPEENEQNTSVACQKEEGNTVINTIVCELVPQKTEVIHHLSYNQLRKFAKLQGVKLKSPKKADLIAALS